MDGREGRLNQKKEACWMTFVWLESISVEWDRVEGRRGALIVSVVGWF